LGPGVAGFDLKNWNLNFHPPTTVTEAKLRKNFDTFAHEFSKRYCCEKKGKYSEWEHLVKMSLVEKGEDLESNFTRIVVHSVRWSELFAIPNKTA